MSEQSGTNTARVLTGLEPQAVWRFFEDICAIPHESGNMEPINRYCIQFAEERNLRYQKDEMGNLILFKEASPGYEEEPTLILQGHLDMVCEKEPGCAIDFAKDGLSLIVEGDMIRADGTTLGGDDGIAVALILAVLDDDTIAHPRLEAVLTAEEEVGLRGAMRMDVAALRGKRMINIDSEREGVIMAGCSGGITIVCNVPVHREVRRGYRCTIRIGGLIGGHSGMEIDKNRANAVQILARILFACEKQVGYAIESLRGGLKDNAIAREAEAVLLLASEAEADQLIAEVTVLGEAIRNEYRTADPQLWIACEKRAGSETEAPVLDAESTRRAICFLLSLPGGVQAMSAEMPGLVESSVNLGVLILDEESNEMCVHLLARSPGESRKREVCDKAEAITLLADGSIAYSDAYPGWAYNPQSPLRTLCACVFEAHLGKPPIIETVHAGLECGIFAGKIDGLDCVSVGPDIFGIHTPTERLSISSTERLWHILLDILASRA